MKTNGSVYAGSWFTGLALALAMLASRQPTQAQTFSVLYSFNGVNGSVPEANLILIGSNLYGTTSYGGAYGDGTVFKLSTSGSETVLHSFAGSDGANPHGSLVRGSTGALYGTTMQGGASGVGVVFEVTP
jgi:uncharacterized repeat protein (TIGR03803 family)